MAEKEKSSSSGSKETNQPTTSIRITEIQRGNPQAWPFLTIPSQGVARDNDGKEIPIDEAYRLMGD